MCVCALEETGALSDDTTVSAEEVIFKALSSTAVSTVTVIARSSKVLVAVVLASVKSDSCLYFLQINFDIVLKTGLH